MEKTKTQKGITLIALIITIVVLLILAAVTISSITSTNLINQATTAGNAWNNAQANENATLGEYESELDSILGEITGHKWVQSGETVTKVSSNGTILSTLVIGNLANGFSTGLPVNEISNEGWRILGAKNGELLLVSLTPRYYGYDLSATFLNKYASAKYATGARELYLNDLGFKDGYSIDSIADYTLNDTKYGDLILNCSDGIVDKWWTNKPIIFGDRGTTSSAHEVAVMDYQVLYGWDERDWGFRRVQ